MAGRVEKLLAFAVTEGYRDLLLGAWGCGVFRNDPGQIAGLFADALDAEVGACFDRVTFAVFDPGPGQATLAAFRERLGKLSIDAR